jgi:hypothetical protein
MAVPIRPASDMHALDAGQPVPLFPTRLATGPNFAATGFKRGHSTPWRPTADF